MESPACCCDTVLSLYTPIALEGERLEGERERMTTGGGGSPSKLGSLRLVVMAGVSAAVFVAYLRYMPAGYGFLVATSAGVGSALAEGSRPPPADPSVIIFNFGDSNSDTGGMAAVNGMNIELPQGRTFFRRPTGRLTDGRLVIDFICESHRVRSLSLTSSHGNF
jgi:hypothetical protein